MSDTHPALAKLAGEEDWEKHADEGGLQQQRHPGLPEQDGSPSQRADHDPDPTLDEDADGVGDRDLFGQLRDLGPLGRAHAMNAGDPHRNPDRDLLPDY